MRRVLTLLDGSDVAASILPDAARLAGTGGEVILIRDVSDEGTIDACEARIAAAEGELRALAAALEAGGISVRTHVSVWGEPVEEIVDAIRTFDPDAVAAVTHARAGLDRLMHGSVSWWLLEHSPVPVLLRHVDDMLVPEAQAPPDLRRNILVPLDGLPVAESALPLACALAEEWDAVLYLARVVRDDSIPVKLSPKDQLASLTLPQTVPLRTARDYLETAARSCPGRVHRAALYGAPVETVSQLADEWWITDIVIASHGRTGLDRLTLGSVTEELIKRSRLPVIVVPRVASANRIERRPAETGAPGYTRR